jgi:hypothetical protein
VGNEISILKASHEELIQLAIQNKTLSYFPIVDSEYTTTVVKSKEVLLAPR